MKEIIEKELSYKLVDIFFLVQRKLGRFGKERQYADVLENEFKKANINYKREYPITLEERESNFVDFNIEDKIFLDIKAKPFVEKADYYQMERYLRFSNLKLGIIVNFRQKYLQAKRVLNPEYNSQYLRPFVVLYRSKAFTMVEMLVALSLFVITLTIAGGSLVKGLRLQKEIGGIVSVNDNISQTIEQMAREIRTGHDFSSSSSDNLQFVNAYGEQVIYQLNNSVIEKKESGKTYPITADNVVVNNLKFILKGEKSGDGLPPRITIIIDVSPKVSHLKNLKSVYQTTISCRNIDT